MPPPGWPPHQDVLVQYQTVERLLALDEARRRGLFTPNLYQQEEIRERLRCGGAGGITCCGCGHQSARRR